MARWLGRQGWLRRGRGRIVDLLGDPARVGDFDFESEFYGYCYQGRYSEYIDRIVYLYGCYERPLLEFLKTALELKSSLGAPVTFYDVGANSGHHSLFLSAHCDNVIAFEPSPRLLERFEQRLCFNRVTNVRIFPVGLGERDATMNYFAGREGNSGAGSFIPGTLGAVAAAQHLEVRVGDRLVADEALPQIDVLKMDVEGFEAPALRGLRRTIQRDRPVILMELGARTKSLVGGEAEFRSLFYEGARFVEVAGQHGDAKWTLRPFRYDRPAEVAIAVVPPHSPFDRLLAPATPRDRGRRKRA